MAEAWTATSTGEPRARVSLRAREIAASMAFDSLRTGYAARKAARLAAANGEPTDLPAGEQAEVAGPAAASPPRPDHQPGGGGHQPAPAFPVLALCLLPSCPGRNLR